MNVRFSRVTIFFLLVIAALIPLVLRYVKYTSNPSEFKKGAAHYATVVMHVLDTKEVFDKIKIGDVRYDGNGAEIMRIMSVSKLEPYVTGRASFNGGNYVDIIDYTQCIFYLTLRVRYQNIGDKLYVHGLGSVLGVNYPIDFSTEKYIVRGLITKVVEI